jgi:hypothetical protein
MKLDEDVLGLNRVDTERNESVESARSEISGVSIVPKLITILDNSLTVLANNRRTIDDVAKILRVLRFEEDKPRIYDLARVRREYPELLHCVGGNYGDLDIRMNVIVFDYSSERVVRVMFAGNYVSRQNRANQTYQKSWEVEPELFERKRLTIPDELRKWSRNS